MKTSNTWFSLIEILVWILIVSIIMIAAFQSLSSVWIAKVKLIEQSEIEKQAYFSSERFFELIKKWGTLDYEEYWNRYSYGTGFIDGHFSSISWFWNQWTIYNCISWVWLWQEMWTWGCLNNSPGYMNDLSTNFTDTHQRFGQYELQFIDRNSDGDADGWDEDGVNGIIWDDDDLFLWIGPNAFSWDADPNKVWELYLISNDGKERTYFRWNVSDVSASNFAPAGASCIWLNTDNPTGIGCNGTIEMLKLVWVDYGLDHVLWTVDTDGSQWDWLIDTWFIHPDYASWDDTIVAWSNSNNYWQPIFPSSINIKDFEIYAYPQKDLNLSWKDPNSNILVAPYLQVKYTIEPSLSVKAKIKGTAPSVKIATTISLSNLDIK